MLQVLESIPPGLLEAPPEKLADVLGGPTLLHLSGRGQGTLFVSTLLHGNETTGWNALRQLLLEFEGAQLPRPLSIFIGNVKAAKTRHRRLDGQPDFNRIWSSKSGPEEAMAAKVLKAIEAIGPIACLDIHNTSGENPVYGCIHRLDDESLPLARAFSTTQVYVEQPDSMLGVACSKFAPTLTLECGISGRQEVTDRTAQFIRACLEQEWPLQMMPLSAQHQLLRPVATVRIPEQISFSFDDQQACDEVDLCFKSGLDGHNFATLPAGTLIGCIRPGVEVHLNVEDASGEDLYGHYFRTEADDLVTASPLIPSLLTVNSRIIRQDCLCYLMEPMSCPGAH
jgi:hypothetical protein